MPLYEYHCSGCDCDVELLQRSSEELPECPECGSSDMQRLLSIVSIGAAQGSSSKDVCETNFGCGKPQCGMGGCAF